MLTLPRVRNMTPRINRLNMSWKTQHSKSDRFELNRMFSSDVMENGISKRPSVATFRSNFLLFHLSDQFFDRPVSSAVEIFFLSLAFYSLALSHSLLRLPFSPITRPPALFPFPRFSGVGTWNIAMATAVNGNFKTNLRQILIAKSSPLPWLLGPCTQTQRLLLRWRFRLARIPFYSCELRRETFFSFFLGKLFLLSFHFVLLILCLSSVIIRY